MLACKHTCPGLLPVFGTHSHHAAWGGAQHSLHAALPACSRKQVTAVDVLPYVGSVEPLLRAVAGVLKRGGRFAFTIEALEPHLPLPAAVARRHTQGV